MDIFRRFIGEMFRDPVGEGKLSFFGEKRDRNGGKAFADGKHAVQGIRLAGGVIALGDQSVPVQQKETVHGDFVRLKTVKEMGDAFAGNACFFGS